jgi:phosphoglycerate dehydrogenase-like enzyme
LVRQQEARLWQDFDVTMIARQTMGIVGYGEIGRAAGRRAEAFGMRVLPHRRRDGGVDRLRTILGECDYVVISTPLTPETRGMIGEAELAAVKRGAVLINIGRGPVVDEAALIKALRGGPLGGAALDVFNTEPLPSDHAFWGMDNVLLSPHSADHIEGWMDDAMRFFVSNLERFRSGQPLENVVDKRAGY